MFNLTPLQTHTLYDTPVGVFLQLNKISTKHFISQFENPKINLLVKFNKPCLFNVKKDGKTNNRD